MVDLCRAHSGSAWSNQWLSTINGTGTETYCNCGSGLLASVAPSGPAVCSCMSVCQETQHSLSGWDLDPWLCFHYIWRETAVHLLCLCPLDRQANYSSSVWDFPKDCQRKNMVRASLWILKSKENDKVKRLNDNECTGIGMETVKYSLNNEEQRGFYFSTRDRCQCTSWWCCRVQTHSADDSEHTLGLCSVCAHTGYWSGCLLLAEVSAIDRSTRLGTKTATDMHRYRRSKKIHVIILPRQ